MTRAELLAQIMGRAGLQTSARKPKRTAPPARRKPVAVKRKAATARRPRVEVSHATGGVTTTAAPPGGVVPVAPSAHVAKYIERELAFVEHGLSPAPSPLPPAKTVDELRPRAAPRLVDVRSLPPSPRLALERSDELARERLAGVTIEPLPIGATGAQGLKLDARPGRCVACDEPLPAGKKVNCGSVECVELYTDVAQRVHKQLRAAELPTNRRTQASAPPPQDRQTQLEQLAEFA